MGINQIALPPSMLADFYKSHLIDTVGQKPVSAPLPPGTTTKKGVQYLGKNQKGICILVSYAKDVYLPDEQLGFLTTILQACRLNLGDVAIVNHYREKILFDEIRQQLTCNYLLVFGIEPSTAGLGEIPLFTIQRLDDCQVICSPAAEQLNNNDAGSKLLKSKLWNCLKQVFNV